MTFRAAAAVAAASLLALSCRRAEETRFLNFDPETSAGRLVSGWSGWEKTAEADTFVWAQARTASLRLSESADGDRVVRFRAWPFRFPDAPGQTVTLLVNGKRAGDAAMDVLPRVYSFAVSRAAWTSGDNDLTFSFSYAESPKLRIPGANDGRTLAAAFDWLDVTPAEPASKR
jgi:hypothetical protein